MNPWLIALIAFLIYSAFVAYVNNRDRTITIEKPKKTKLDTELLEQTHIVIGTVRESLVNSGHEDIWQDVRDDIRHALEIEKPKNV